MSKLPEVWLRGPLTNIPALLQPVAHALLQAREEIESLMAGFPEELLWDGVAGLASPGFHLQHITGVINRLFTYANGNQLNQQQLDYLKAEGTPNALAAEALVSLFSKQVDQAIEQLIAAAETKLTEFRGVGRAQLPSTVIGLYVHAAEHAMRHTGQLLVTVKVLMNKQD